MFSLPQPPNNETVDERPVVDLSEDAELVRSLITVLYPIPSEIPTSYDRVLALLAAARKYDMDAVESTIRGEVARKGSPVLDGAQAFRAYAIASSNRLTPEMDMAASLTLDYPMTFEHLGGNLRLFEGWALRELAGFRKGCRDALVSCLESFLDTVNGRSVIWTGCYSRQKVQSPTKGGTALPVWVHDYFTQQIEQLKQDFTRPLLKPSTVRANFLGALQNHSISGRCKHCLQTFATKGDNYCMELEQAIFRARQKACVDCRP